MGHAPARDATRVFDGDDLQRVIRRIAHEILERHRGAENVVFVGIRTRGVHLARSLAAAIGAFEAIDVPVVELDVSAYRDDREPPSDATPALNGDAPVSGSSVIVVDDVLYTGRTVRAALDAISDEGRAASVELAVLVDRGHRGLPIRADYVGKNLPTSRSERVQVCVEAVDGRAGVWIEKAET
jgi:pyrimidine operon attenuation protein / uracil phosphoribosyltransferase